MYTAFSDNAERIACYLPLEEEPQSQDMLKAIAYEIMNTEGFLP